MVSHDVVFRCLILRVRPLGPDAGTSEVGVTNAEGPPVPIPNTEVKLCSGENTWLEAARENSSMPTQDRERIKPFPNLKKETQ